MSPNQTFFSPTLSTPVLIQIQLPQWMALSIIGQVKNTDLIFLLTYLFNASIKTFTSSGQFYLQSIYSYLPNHYPSPMALSRLSETTTGVSRFALLEILLAFLVFLISILLTATRMTKTFFWWHHLSLLKTLQKLSTVLRIKTKILSMICEALQNSGSAYSQPYLMPVCPLFAILQSHGPPLSSSVCQAPSCLMALASTCTSFPVTRHITVHHFNIHGCHLLF